VILLTRRLFGHRAQAQRGLEQENHMKTLLAIIALIIIVGVQALSPPAGACTGTYAGYPCSQWNSMQDRW
jgi:hypothetical protein